MVNIVTGRPTWNPNSYTSTGTSETSTCPPYKIKFITKNVYAFETHLGHSNGIVTRFF